MDFFEDIDFENLGEGEDKNKNPADELQAEVREKLAKQRTAAAAATEAENEETKPIGAGAYLAKMAAKTAKDKEESAAKELVRTALKKKNEKISIEPVVGDQIAAMIPQQIAGDNDKDGFSDFVKTAMQLGKFAATLQEGGQIASKIKTKAKPKAKKRYVRGVGAAKRGYGKATYSKKMY